MPILVLALIALACFGLIGILLATAVILERKNSAGSQPSNAEPAHKPTIS
jgi:hypothetical protein